MKKTLRINSNDDVVVALDSINKDDEVLVEGATLKVTDNIDMGHKIALRDLSKGDDILKYGYPIGKASKDIKKGSLVHSHNLETGLGEIDEYTYEPKLKEMACKKEDLFFNGYKGPCLLFQHFTGNPFWNWNDFIFSDIALQGLPGQCHIRVFTLSGFEDA